jgi:hypothetical protein
VVEVKCRDCSQGSPSSSFRRVYLLRSFTGYEDGATVLEVFLDSWEIDISSFLDLNLLTGVIAEQHDLVGWSAFGFCLDYFSQHVSFSFPFARNNMVLAVFWF